LLSKSWEAKQIYNKLDNNGFGDKTPVVGLYGNGAFALLKNHQNDNKQSTESSIPLLETDSVYSVLFPKRFMKDQIPFDALNDEVDYVEDILTSSEKLRFDDESTGKGSFSVIRYTIKRTIKIL